MKTCYALMKTARYFALNEAKPPVYTYIVK